MIGGFQVSSDRSQNGKKILVKTQELPLVDLEGETEFLMSSAVIWIQYEMGLAVTDLTVPLLESLRAVLSHLESLDFLSTSPNPKGTKKVISKGGVLVIRE